MAFWGIELKPGKPVTHSFHQVRGRLHVSQATLGIGSSSKKSLVQCNVGDKSPVFLCALLPDKTESCHLDLEYEEAEDVVFSVIGPRSVYLTGYFLGSRCSHMNDDSESYGEDIANSETEESARDSKEDDYEDSFIDDGDPEVLPPSPISSERASDEKLLDTKKPKERKCFHKRLKKYQSIESDDENSPQPHKVVTNHTGISALESEDEEKFPISSLCKSRTEKEDKLDKEKSKTGEKKTTVDGARIRTVDDRTGVIEQNTDGEAVVADKQPQSPDSRSGPPSHCLPSSNDLSVNQTKSKKRKGRTKQKETPEADDSNTEKDDKTLRYKAEVKKPSTDRGVDQAYDSLLPSSKSDSENCVKTEKRKKESDAKGKSVEGIANIGNVFKEAKVKQNDGDDKRSGKDISMRNEKDQTFPYDKNVGIASSQVVDQDQFKGKRSKKKKKKTKIPEEEGDMSLKGFDDKNLEAKSSQTRTLSNGLIIQELEVGECDGKVAAPGKKVKVHYVGKLRKGRQIFDSNIGKSPFKFRLGAEDVIEGWNIGLDGMRVGGKRRLMIPPIMGYGSQGAGENIPPNSWLVYEVELVGVR